MKKKGGKLPRDGFSFFLWGERFISPPNLYPETEGKERGGGGPDHERREESFSGLGFASAHPEREVS